MVVTCIPVVNGSNTDRNSYCTTVSWDFSQSHHINTGTVATLGQYKALSNSLLSNPPTMLGQRPIVRYNASIVHEPQIKLLCNSGLRESSRTYTDFVSMQRVKMHLLLFVIQSEFYQLGNIKTLNTTKEHENVICEEKKNCT